METLGQRLRMLRERRGLSRQEVADRIGVTYWAVCKYETDKRTPDCETVKKLADLYEVSIDFLDGRDQDVFPEDAYEEAKQKVDVALADDEELMAFWNELKKRDDLQLLFRQVRPMSPKTIKKVIKAIEEAEEMED